MIFEGSEKKIEVIVHSSVGSLRMLEYGFWQQLVVNANAEILSVVSNEQCDAYLLSESSLFVWDDRFLMITCGTTTLVNAVVQFIHKVGEPNIARASYHRKSEYFAHLQSSFFKDDLVSLKQNLIGTAYRIGHLDTHHHYWFITDKSDTTSVKDRRYELQMYHITGFAAAYLRGREHTRAGIRKLLQLDELFTGFELDDHLFEPMGYSINGIKDNEYFTIHITPQQQNSYVSFETNMDLATEPNQIFKRLLDILQPGSWDVIGINAANEVLTATEALCLGQCVLNPKQGIQFDFRHYQQPWHQQITAEVI